MRVAQSTNVIDDDRVRVTRWTFSPTGDSTGPHVHEHDYIVVPVTGGTFVIKSRDGALHELIQYAGTPYRGAAGTAHEVTSTAGAVAIFVEIELKKAMMLKSSR